VFAYDINQCLQESNPNVLIDFSLPEVLDRTIAYASVFNSPLVIGTTGYTESQSDKIRELSKTIPVVQSYNFSIGIQMLIKCTELLSANLTDWDVEISETHHRFKKDKPSGTAIMLKNAVGKDVNISSLRLGNVPGEHTVSFGGLGEVISLSHSATSRRTFAEGVLKASEFAHRQKEPGLFSFRDVLFTK
ncbi:MAG: dihydrodipicolinate reductase C-terminal domain-containing protein, partial [Ignavibacteria bacterium]